MSSIGSEARKRAEDDLDEWKALLINDLEEG